jgi:hypothetical protein
VSDTYWDALRIDGGRPEGDDWWTDQRQNRQIKELQSEVEAA